MIGRSVALVVLVAAPSAFAIGHWQGEHGQPEAQISAVQVNAPIISKPGAGAASAAKYLAAFQAPPPPPPPPPPSPAQVAASRPMLPPPEAIDIQFRRDVTAVMTSGEPHVVLAGGRRLTRGQVYLDGWKVSALTAQNAVLSKGRETRNVNLFSAPPQDLSMVQVAAVAPIITGPMSLTNGVTPEQQAAAMAQRLALMSPDQRRAFMQAQGIRGGNMNFGGGGGGRNGGGEGGGRRAGGGGNQGPNAGFGGGGGGRGQGGFGGGQGGGGRTAPVQ